MVEIWTAVSQDELLQLLTLLRDNGIEAQYKVDGTEADAFVTTSLQVGAFRIFVEKEYAEQAAQLIRDYFENPPDKLMDEKEEDYSEYENDILIHKLVGSAGSGREKILAELYKRGYTDSKIEKEIAAYIEINRRFKESTSGWSARIIIATAKFFKFDVREQVSKIPPLGQLIIALAIITAVLYISFWVIAILMFRAMDG